MVSSHENKTNAVLNYWGIQTPTFRSAYTSPWLCRSSDTDIISDYDIYIVAKNAAPSGTWFMNRRPIEHCLSQSVEEHCRLQFSTDIVAIVIACNLVKMFVMGYVHGRGP